MINNDFKNQKVYKLLYNIVPKACHSTVLITTDATINSIEPTIKCHTTEGIIRR